MIPIIHRLILGIKLFIWIFCVRFEQIKGLTDYLIETLLKQGTKFLKRLTDGR